MTPWDGYACPGASVGVMTAGTFTIAVGQWGGGCAAGLSDYQLYVAVNGADVAPTLSADNVPTSVLFP